MWVTDRPPTQSEIDDHHAAYATIKQVDLHKRIELRVKMVSGFILRAYPIGEQWGYNREIIAWMMPPMPHDLDREARESAELLLALRDGSDAKLREYLHRKEIH